MRRRNARRVRVPQCAVPGRFPVRGLGDELSAYQEDEPCVPVRRVGRGRVGSDGIERRLQADVFGVQHAGESPDGCERLGDDLLMSSASLTLIRVLHLGWQAP